MVTNKYVFHFKITRFTSKGLITYLYYYLPLKRVFIINSYTDILKVTAPVLQYFLSITYCVPTLHNNYCSKVDFEQYQYYSIFYKIIKKLSIPVSSMTLTTDWMSSLEKAEKTAILEDDVALKASNFPT